MKKRNLLAIGTGVLLMGLFVFLVLTISRKKAEIDSLNMDLKNKDNKVSRLEKQVEGLNTEKIALAGARLSLEAKLVNLEQDIDSAREKETILSKKLGAFAQEKKKLEDDLAQATRVLQDKLKSLTEENQKESALKTEQYMSQKNEFINQIEQLNNKLSNLNEENSRLEKSAKSASEVTTRLTREKEKLDHYRAGLSSENKGDYEAAVKEYEEILKLDPQDADIYCRLSGIYTHNIKDRKKADFYAQGYAVLNNQTAPAGKSNEAGQKPGLKNKKRHILGGDLNGVLGPYREKAPRHYYNLAIIYEDAGRYKEAVQEYKKILELAPDNADVNYNLGIIYDDHFQDNEKANYYYGRYLELCPDAADAGTVRGWMDESREDLEWQRKMR
ncbi:MAG: tetratricopeptide repeat protein [Candidatus Omnitrophota bacterium]|jgi:tetratricopeptide (TPR) repeat protein